MKDTIVGRIAEWSANLTLQQVPAEARTIARSCILDTLGVALAGTRTRPFAIAQDLIRNTGGRGNSLLLGTDERFSPTAASFANAVAAHALDFDDNCNAGMVHGSAVVLPAALAATEFVDGTGEDLLTAFIAGLEAEFALGAAATLRLYERGWWTTSVLGPVGACVATARALCLNAAATASAIGIAIAGTGGVKAVFGTDGKPLLAGRASENGVFAALLAARGATGPRDVVQSERGFARLVNEGVLVSEEIDALGQQWRLLSPGIDVKRIPVCLSSHAAVDATVQLVQDCAIQVPAIARIVCDVSPIAAANLKHTRPRTAQEAQFSVQFPVAASLLIGKLGLEQLDDSLVRAPALVELMRRIELASTTRWDADLLSRAPEGAHVRIELGDGETHEAFQAVARGCASLPLTASELEAKFRSCTDHSGLDIEADRLLDRLRAIEQVPRIRSVFHR